MGEKQKTKAAKERFLLRLHPDEDARMRKSLSGTSLSTRAELAKAALRLFELVRLGVVRHGDILILSKDGEVKSPDLHLETASKSGPTKLSVQGVAFELLLSKDDIRIIQEALALHIGPSSSEIVRMAIRLYLFLAERVGQGWTPQFRSADPITIPVPGLGLSRTREMKPADKSSEHPEKGERPPSAVYRGIQVYE